MSDSTSCRRAAVDTFRARDFYLFWILLSLFGICTAFYYLGEIADFIGWELNWEYLESPHDVHRLLFFAPVVYAGYFFRVKGAVIVAVAAFMVCLPRALAVSPYPDPVLRIGIFALAAGVIGSLTAVAHNNSERRARLEALVEEERDKLFAILERMEDGVYIVGPDYRIRFMNTRLEKDFGKGVGHHCYECLHKFDTPCDQICKLPEVLVGTTATYEYVLPDGRAFEVIASPFVDFDGTVCQLATFRNITERKKVEDELMRLNELKSDLLSNVSHEFKSPLTSIKGIVSSLLQKDISWDEGDREMLLNGVGQETDRLASLVTNLLNMSKLEAGVWKPEKERCHIEDIIGGALEHEKWISKNHIFNVHLDPNLPEIHADYSQIRQVLINLLENAVSYSAEGTQITVEAKNVCGNVEVSVSDEGGGIPQGDLESIFEKFYRGSHERRMPGGTGLGLAICQSIILAHDGQIWADSEIGRGSTFHFTLPVSGADDKRGIS